MQPSPHGSVVQRKTYSTPIVQGNGGTHFFLKYWGIDPMKGLICSVFCISKFFPVNSLT